MLRVGSDFSGVGAFNQSLIRLGIDYKEVFACDMDKYARQTFIANYGEPSYYPTDVYEREIPKESLDIYMTSPPCQAFSLAGNRKGEEDKRGILFYNSHEFIQTNKPRFFVFENVKGLMSDNDGKTFGKWIEYLGGKSVNGVLTMFPHEDSVPYHIYYQVLNAKDYGIPQNRERIFIVGIRDDRDNQFVFPKPKPLTKRLKDVLEENVDEKYYLSEKMTEMITYNGKSNGIIADLNKGGQKGEVHSEDSKYISCLIATDYKQPKQIAIPSATSKGYEIAEVGEDSINFEHPNSETRRGRVGKSVAQTLTTSCNQGIFTKNLFNTDKNINFDGILKSIDNEKRNTAKVLLMLQQEIGKTAIETWGLRILEIIREKTLLQHRLYEESFYSKRKKSTRGTINKIQQTESIKINSYVIMRSLPKEGWERCSSQRRKSIKQLIRELNESLQKLSYENPQTNSDLQSGELQYENKGLRILREALSKIQEIWESINSETQPILRTQRIRRLTPTEAFRLMDFPDSLVDNARKVNMSDSQLYKQAGNSICVGVLTTIIERINNIIKTNIYEQLN